MALNRYLVPVGFAIRLGSGKYLLRYAFTLPRIVLNIQGFAFSSALNHKKRRDPERSLVF